MKSTKFWMTLFAILLVVATISTVIIFKKSTKGVIANIYQYGECIYSIDLSSVKESYNIQIDGKVTNDIIVEPGRICVFEATCPDQVCVRQGWISNSIIPIVCLPNSMSILIEENSKTEFDTIVR